MTRSYYHATSYSNLCSILENGIIPSSEGIVYLADSMLNAQKFVYIRGVRDILVIEVLLEEEFVEEQYDHNEKFFQCKAYGYEDPIYDSSFGELRRFEYE